MTGGEGEVARIIKGIIDGHCCPLSTVRSTRGSVLFHYRADVLLGFFDSLHLREVRYSCASTERVLVFYLPKQTVWVSCKGSKEQVSERQFQEGRDTAKH